MSTRRRAFERIPLAGTAEVLGTSYEIGDVSFGGIGLVGDARSLRVGSPVPVILRTPLAERIAVTAFVRHADACEAGLSFAGVDPYTLERLVCLLDDAARTAVPEPIAER